MRSGDSSGRSVAAATDETPAGGRRIRALFSMPCAGVGVGMTCRSLLRGASAAGIDVDLFTSRFDEPSGEGFAVHEVLPSALRFAPYPFMRPLLERRLNRRYLDALGGDDIAYLWPSVPNQVYAELARRGFPIVGEAINTLMAKAKPVLDEAYAELGLVPAHGITQRRIDEQMARYSLCAHIFAPSPATEAALVGTGLEDRVVPSSYGTWVPPTLPPQKMRHAGQGVRFLFVGSASVRKGIHHLLDAWRDVPATAHLRIVGVVEPAIRQIFRDVLAQPNVSCGGFQRDVREEYLAADALILPSLEEGDPIVTYEATAHGLPVVASAMGAGRIGAETGAVLVIDTSCAAALRDTVERLAASPDLRLEWAQKARLAVQDYDWARVAPRRFARLFGAMAA